MTILEDLWYRNIDPHETILKGNKQFKNFLSLMGRNRDKLNDSLTDQQKELLEKYDDVINEMHSSQKSNPSLAAFPSGFG